MKITVDIDELADKNVIDDGLREKLIANSVASSGSLIAGALLSFGVLSIAFGVAILFQSLLFTSIIGLILAVWGLHPSESDSKTKKTFSSVLLSVGTLTFAIGVVAMSEGNVFSQVFLSVLFAIAAIIAKSGLMVCLSPIFFASAVGFAGGLQKSTYFIGASSPLVIIVVFSAAAFFAWKNYEDMDNDDKRLIALFSRTCIILVNIGFLTGTFTENGLWFSIAWPISLLTLAIWAAKSNLRWTVNVCIIFGSIHFYSKYLELIPESAFTFILAGIITIAIVIFSIKLNLVIKENAEESNVMELPIPLRKAPSWNVPVVSLRKSEKKD